MRCHKPHLNNVPLRFPVEKLKIVLVLAQNLSNRPSNCMPHPCSRRILVKNAYFAAGVPHQSHVTRIDQ